MVPEEASYMNFRDHPSMDYTAQQLLCEVSMEAEFNLPSSDQNTLVT